MKRQKYFVDYEGTSVTIMPDKRDEGKSKLWFFDEPTITFACKSLTDAQNVAGALLGWLTDPDQITNRMIIDVDHVYMDDDLDDLT